MFCKQCGNEVVDTAVVCPRCGVATGYVPMEQRVQTPVVSASSRMTYVLLGFFLGGFGIHNFYAGYAGRGIAQLFMTLFGFVLIFPLLIVGVWVLIELFTVTTDSKGLRLS